VRIVRLANFVAPRSGGLRTALRELGAGYLAAGHEPVLIVPGDCDHDAQTPQGRVITLRGPLVPLSGGYRLLLSRRRVTTLLNALRPDRLEVSDRVTLRWTGPWARRHGSRPSWSPTRAWPACSACPRGGWPVRRKRSPTRSTPRAEEFGWEASVGGFLAAHGVSEAVPA
jgi:hypothetical protein